MTRLCPHQMLAEADHMLQNARLADARWLRATALLYRSALEIALEQFWCRKRVHWLRSTPFRSQMACLRVYGSTRLAGEAHWVWAALSESSHYRSELGPDRSGLRAHGLRTHLLVARLADPKSPRSFSTPSKVAL